VAFDLKGIVRELQAAPLASPYPLDLSAAIVNDTFRMALARPVPKKQWDGWQKEKPVRWAEQMGMLAHALAVTSLRAETVRALHPGYDAAVGLQRMFELIEPLTAEMIRSNRFRQEEFLRKWASCVGGRIEGEKARESKQRMEQLDYRKTLAEYAKAEKARKSEAAARAKMLREAAQREAQARGWRE